MPRKPGHDRRRRQDRTAAQQEWAAAVGCASRAWEALTDEQRLSWNVDAESRRTSGHRRFTGVNARRFLDDKEMLRLPPGLPPSILVRLLKRLVITNRRGRIRLKLEFSHVPTTPITVWASRPCKQGRSGCRHCPRLGPLPPLAGGVCDITELYFQKHGEYIMRHDVPLIGMRIFVRIRQELDGGSKVYEAAAALVPPPKG